MAPLTLDRPWPRATRPALTASLFGARPQNFVVAAPPLCEGSGRWGGMFPGATLNLDELEQLARERLPKMAYDYYASGARGEDTLRENVAAWARIPLYHRVLVDVSVRSLSTTVLGAPVSMPVLVAPTAFHKLACEAGELATARAAARSRAAGCSGAPAR